MFVILSAPISYIYERIRILYPHTNKNAQMQNNVSAILFVTMKTTILLDYKIKS